MKLNDLKTRGQLDNTAGSIGTIKGIAVPKSEHEIESQNMATSLAQLTERLNVLELRLGPVLTPVMTGSGSEDKCMAPSPTLSPLGHQLRGYSDEIERAASRINGILQQLALD